MISHPDADAFMAVYLREPNDATMRLIFADWLEETGEPSNVAWARFIRLKIEADQYPAGSAERVEVETEAGGFAWQIRANLTIPASVVVNHLEPLLRLLPSPNMTVRLAGYDVPRAALALMPHAVAYENLVLPLDLRDSTLVVAARHPHDWDMVRKLQFILNRDVIAFRAEEEDLHAAIAVQYGPFEADYYPGLTELVDVAIPLEAFDLPTPVAITEAPPVTLLVNQMLLDAITSGANRIHIQPTISAARVEFRFGCTCQERDELPRRLLAGVAARIAVMSGIVLELDREGRAGGEFRFNYHGAVYTVRTAMEATPGGPVIDLDISDQFELA